jgi:DNA end-binding protein Ku
MLHTMYFADEIRDFGEVEKGEDAKVKPGELELAERLVGELSSESFRPEHYADEYRTRVLQVVESKVEGREVTSLAPQAQRAQVIDLMEALKQSLGKRGSGAAAGAPGEAAAQSGAKKAESLEKKPAARARKKAEPAPREKKVQSKR